MGSWEQILRKRRVYPAVAIILEFWEQGYNRVNQKCFSFTLEKGPRTINIFTSGIQKRIRGSVTALERSHE